MNTQQVAPGFSYWSCTLSLLLAVCQADIQSELLVFFALSCFVCVRNGQKYKMQHWLRVHDTLNCTKPKLPNKKMLIKEKKTSNIANNLFWGFFRNEM